MDTSRVIVTVIISLVLIIAYQELVLKRLYPPQTQSAPANKNLPTSAASPSTTSAEAPLTMAPGATPSAAAPGAPEHTYQVETNLFIATFTSHGGRLRSLKLKKYKQFAGPTSPLYEMVRAPYGGRLPLGALLTHSGQLFDDSAMTYTSSSPDKVSVDGGASTLTLDGQTPDGEKIEKTFTFKNDTYAFDMDVTAAGPAAPDELGISMSQPLGTLTGYRDYPELQADVGDKVFTQLEKKLKQGVPPVSGTITFAGFGDRYFLGAFLPSSPASGTLLMAYADDEAIARLLFPKAMHVSTQVYMGPKLLEALESVNPSLHKAIDFGWAGILALAFLRALKLFHLIAPNWGVDILLMTAAIRIAFLPLSIKSQRSMLKMQRLQPQMTKLREKYKDNNDQLQREMMDLYKRNHVNPLGGCAPMALQLPIFIGLYEALLNSIELRHAPFVGWINDLSVPDCLHISWMPQLPLVPCHGLPVLVLLMGLSSFGQQYLTPTSPDPNQQKMMMLTPLIFTVMLINFPSGLSLYYFASNMLGVIQQFFLNREMKSYTPAT
ncbi:MAG TPA: membrane protein insertase YidC [Candidatus Binataceae bacterium]|nr:membrane protein insertase YidC [Candidatus Binataceae bacterium]